MNQNSGIFLESLFLFFAVSMIIFNEMIGAILFFILAGLIDICWEWGK